MASRFSTEEFESGLEEPISVVPHQLVRVSGRRRRRGATRCARGGAGRAHGRAGAGGFGSVLGVRVTGRWEDTASNGGGGHCTAKGQLRPKHCDGKRGHAGSARAPAGRSVGGGRWPWTLRIVTLAAAAAVLVAVIVGVALTALRRKALDGSPCGGGRVLPLFCRAPRTRMPGHASLTPAPHLPPRRSPTITDINIIMRVAAVLLAMLGVASAFQTTPVRSHTRVIRQAAGTSLPTSPRPCRRPPPASC